jgi:hypothetical protein
LEVERFEKELEAKLKEKEIIVEKDEEISDDKNSNL